MAAPTYQELIELLEEAEKLASQPGAVLSAAELLTTNFSHLYPHIKIGRPGRFLETVRRIHGPLKTSSLNGKTKQTYLKRLWSPRVRNLCTSQCVESQSFPDELTKNYGLRIEYLNEIFQATNSPTAYWSLHSIPTVQFYRKLHPFLKKWSTTRSLPKASLGRFYLSIDSQLQARNSTPYNTYRFVERVVSSDAPDSTIVPYGDKTVSILQAEIRSCIKQVQDLDRKVAEQEQGIKEMKREIEKTKGLAKACN